MPSDSVYQQYTYQPNVFPHHYDNKLWLIADPVSLHQLAQLGHPDTQNPRLSTLLQTLYRQLAHVALATVMPREHLKIKTRMHAHTERGVWEGSVVALDGPIITCAIARAGLLSSQMVFDLLCDLFPSNKVRQDHISMNRVSDGTGKVTGVAIQGCKMGDGAANSTVIIPDPMGASGVTMNDAVTLYKNHAKGPPRRIIALHLIVTPEYLRALRQTHPDVLIFAFRVDRGNSTADVLQSQLGACEALEQGLNEQQYIVPGAGGLGEVLNHCET